MPVTLVGSVQFDNDRASEKKEMVCQRCYRLVLCDDTSWTAAARRRCLYCKRGELTPFLDVRVGSRRLRHYSFAEHRGR